MKVLEGKVAIITGGARGIGKAVSRKFYEEGAKVLICSRTVSEVEKTCQELDPTGEKIIGAKVDVALYPDCQRLVEYAIKCFGRVDILVNNAGIYGPIGPLETNDPQKWAEAIRINLIGTMHCCHAVLPYFKKQNSGKIINLAGAGIGGKKPFARFSSYYTSKGAIAAFTEVIACEVAENKIQVNCISPGSVNTQLTEYLLQHDRALVGEDFYEKSIKQKETGGDSPELAANLAVFLASDRTNHITGRMISAKWDDLEKLASTKPVRDNLYTLRRIDDVFFYEK